MKFFCSSFFLLLFCFCAVGQGLGDYNLAMKTNRSYGNDAIKSFSKSKNAYDFMALGYFLNANTNMYLKTGNVAYLESNLAVIKPILLDNSSASYTKNNWKMNVAKGNQNAVVNGQEHLISEAYFFRYVGEFLYVIRERGLFKNYQGDILKGLEYSFSKWKDRSFAKYGDYSLLFHQRLHTGANWATVALYLNEFDPSGRAGYTTFIDQFDDQLNKALVLKSKWGQKYYIWNSTYPEQFCTALKSIKRYAPVVQDVSHGNHVVLYLLKARELGNKNWYTLNFDYLSNTLKINILKKNGFADNVDGSTSASVVNTGWKVSDGWYKLIYKDKSLYRMFEKSLMNYKSKIKGSSLEGQFYSIYL